MGFEASHSCWQGPAERLLGRRDIVALMGELCRDSGAEHYVVCQIGSRQGAQCQRILASNWLYDALEDVGAETLARILRSHLADQFGEEARPFGLEALAELLALDRAECFERNGIRELAGHRLAIGGARFGVLFSASTPGAMRPAAATKARMICGYALSRIDPDLVLLEDDPLSDRERECMRWVSEGKTTDEVAMILGVSSNTVNSYVGHAMQKLSASNRAMAMATAIRSGLI
jgi:DNA-binding CsgD family transcriptional regulator